MLDQRGCDAGGGRDGAGAEGPGPVRSEAPSNSSASYGVAGLNTIRQTQQMLVEDGMVETRQGVGTFVLRPSRRPARST